MELLFRLLLRLYRKSPPACQRLVAVLVVASGLTMIVLALLGHLMPLVVPGTVFLLVVGVGSWRAWRSPYVRYRGPFGWPL